MHRIPRFALAVLPLGGCEPALSPVALSDTTPGCFLDLPVTELLVSESGPDEMTAIAAIGGNPAFLSGHLSYLRTYNREPPAAEDAVEPHGGVVYVQDDAGWRAILPSEGEATVAIYVSPDSPDVYFLSQLQVEGPGQSFTLTRSTDGLKTAACTLIEFPPDLNQPSWAMEFLTPEFLQIRRRAEGELVGSAELDQETSQTRTVWYRYRTSDGGATWSPPVTLDAQPATPEGPLVAVKDPAPDDMVNALTAFARGK
jgi:hypothetical protein